MLDVDPVTKLCDIEAIKGVKAAYFRCIDFKQYSELASLFTEDAQFDNLVVPCDDVEMFVSACEERHAGVTTIHHGHLPEVTIESPTFARAIWPMSDYLEWPAGESPPEHPDARGFRGYGHYEEEYRKEGDGTWRISFLRLTRVRIDLILE